MTELQYSITSTSGAFPNATNLHLTHIDAAFSFSLEMKLSPCTSAEVVATLDKLLCRSLEPRVFIDLLPLDATDEEALDSASEGLLSLRLSLKCLLGERGKINEEGPVKGKKEASLEPRESVV